MTDPVELSWKRFERALPKLRLPKVALAGGVSEQVFAHFEAATALVLPPAVRSFFRCHDGQTSSSAGLASGFVFVSLDEAHKLLNDWGAVRSKLGDGVRELDRACSSHPPNAIQRRYSLAGWLPLLRDNEGNAIGVDLDPGPLGVVGQIINFGRDEEEKFVLFRGVSDLLDWLAEETDTGRIAYDHEDKIVRHRDGRLVAVLTRR